MQAPAKVTGADKVRAVKACPFPSKPTSDNRFGSGLFLLLFFFTLLVCIGLEYYSWFPPLPPLKQRGSFLDCNKKPSLLGSVIVGEWVTVQDFCFGVSFLGWGLSPIVSAQVVQSVFFLVVPL